MTTSGRAARELGHDARPVGRGEVVRHAGDDRHASASGRPGRGVGDRASRSRPGRRRSRCGASAGVRPRREASSARRERRRVRAEVGAARADAEDHRQPAAGQAVGDRSGLPVDEPCGVGRLARGDREVRRVGADDDADALVRERGHDAGASWPLSRSRTSSSIRRPPTPPSALTMSAAIRPRSSSWLARTPAVPGAGTRRRCGSGFSAARRLLAEVRHIRRRDERNGDHGAAKTAGSSSTSASSCSRVGTERSATPRRLRGTGDRRPAGETSELPLASGRQQDEQQHDRAGCNQRPPRARSARSSPLRSGRDGAAGRRSRPGRPRSSRYASGCPRSASQVLPGVADEVRRS